MNCILLFLCLAMSGASQPADAEVRAALERRYEEIARATERLDLAAFRAIRHETFHTVGPDGRINGPTDMDNYSKQFFSMNTPPLTARFTIRTLRVSGDGMVAVVEVFQELSRFQQVEGQRRKVETTVVQNETWFRTNDGWKLKLVDNVHDQTRRVVEGPQ